MESIPQWFIDLMDEVTNNADGEYGEYTLSRYPFIMKRVFDENGELTKVSTDKVSHNSYQYVWEQINLHLNSSEGT